MLRAHNSSAEKNGEVHLKRSVTGRDVVNVYSGVVL